MIVYVLNRKGKPLMPTSRCGHVRKLLKAGLAVPVCNNPFTIRLKYDTGDVVQPVYLGMDTGRQNIGVSASDESGNCILLTELKTHNKSIKKQMADRRMHRMSRRRHRRKRNQRRAICCHVTIQKGKKDILGAIQEDGRKNKTCKSVDIRYPGAEEPVTHKVCRGKEARFNNRRRRDGWLPPSGRQLLLMHMGVLRETLKFLPVSHVVMERAAFDFQKLENENIRAWEYGKGPLYGFPSYKEYVHALQKGKCLLCEEDIEHYHHIRKRKDGGTDQARNIAGLCLKCHERVHKEEEYEQLLLTTKTELTNEYSIGLLNSVMPRLIEEMKGFCDSRNISFSLTDGKTAKEARDRLDIPKGHALDAYAISLVGRSISKAGFKTDTIYLRNRFKKKSKGCIKKLGRREYLYNGKVVAVNRHKAMDQKEDSLEEYMARYAKSHTDLEFKRHFHELEIKPARRVYTFHKKNQKAGMKNMDKIRIPVKTGDLVRYEKHNKTKGNMKTNMFVAERINLSNRTVCFGTKGRQLKYCSPLNASNMPITGKEKVKLNV